MPIEESTAEVGETVQQVVSQIAGRPLRDSIRQKVLNIGKQPSHKAYGKDCQTYGN